MIENSFRDFFEYTYHEDGFHELYVMKNGLNEILYIGISSDNIWNCWFGSRGHIMVGTNYLIGETSVGRKVVDHLPDSWDWKIQLWTLNDCLAFCAGELNPIRPSLNVIYNLDPGADTMPLSEREKKRQDALDKAYREVFEKNLKWKQD